MYAANECVCFLCEELFAEVSLEKSCKSLAVSRLVASHLMDCVVDSVETLCLCELCKLGLAEGSAVLRLNSHLEVLLRRVGYDLAEELGELGGVLSLFVSCLLPVETDLGIALSVCDSRLRSCL